MLTLGKVESLNNKIKEEHAQAEALRVDRDRLQEKLDALVAAKDKEVKVKGQQNNIQSRLNDRFLDS